VVRPRWPESATRAEQLVLPALFDDLNALGSDGRAFLTFITETQIVNWTAGGSDVVRREQCARSLRSLMDGVLDLVPLLRASSINELAAHEERIEAPWRSARERDFFEPPTRFVSN
jgi:hypothetical protein